MFSNDSKFEPFDQPKKIYFQETLNAPETTSLTRRPSLSTRTISSEEEKPIPPGDLSDFDPPTNERLAIYLKKLRLFLDKLPKTTRPKTKDILNEITKNELYLHKIISNILILESFNISLTMPIIAAFTHHGEFIEEITHGLIKLLTRFNAASVTENILILVETQKFAPKVCKILIDLDNNDIHLTSDLIKIIAENASNPNLAQIARALMMIANTDRPFLLSPVALSEIINVADPRKLVWSMLSMRCFGFRMHDSLIKMLAEYSETAEESIFAIQKCIAAEVLLTREMISQIFTAKDKAERFANHFIEKRYYAEAEKKVSPGSRKLSLSLKMTHFGRPHLPHSHSSSPDLSTEANGNSSLNHQTKLQRLSFLCRRTMHNLKKSAKDPAEKTHRRPSSPPSR